MKRILQILCTILCLTFVLSACTPTDTDTAARDPEEVINLYYQSVIEDDFSTAYLLLSETAIENLTEDEFTLYEELYDEINELKSFEITEILMITQLSWVE